MLEAAKAGRIGYGVAIPLEGWGLVIYYPGLQVNSNSLGF